MFVTCLDEAEIGFASFDPRPAPDFGIIGHNCVLPSFQRDGVGKRQVMEILERFRKMYLGCGFHEKRRWIKGPDPRYELVEYEISL